MVDGKQFMSFALDKLGFKSQEDLFENLYLKAFIDSYHRIGKDSILEEKIRDRFVFDLERENPLTKNLIQQQILLLNWERWQNVSEEERSRADISFSISGFEFIIECKRLKYADNRYLEGGLKRFVELKYAKNDSHAGMIGFVINGEIKPIVEVLKAKVNAFHFTPGSENLLKKSCLDWEYSFQSRHDRSKNTQIQLYHLFFDFIPRI
ncbi:MAG: hypothetical protein NT166_04470 [Candidatus Aminicenantes bacterium]|nr:hypothetical protein [Candidatus Aminicenantes bacterium]